MVGKVFRVWVTFVVGIGKSTWIHASCSVGVVGVYTCQTVTQRLEFFLVATLVAQGLVQFIDLLTLLINISLRLSKILAGTGQVCCSSSGTTKATWAEVASVAVSTPGIPPIIPLVHAALHRHIFAADFKLKWCTMLQGSAREDR